MNVLVVICHPRRESLTGALADAFVEGLDKAGHTAEIADLYAENFDPLVQPADEPDYDDPTKVYSPEVRVEMARIRNDAIAMFFPVWWWSVPAMLKGWIDRVWNHGWAYGWEGEKASLPVDKILMVALAGSPREDYEKRDFDKAMDVQLRIGITNYCGVADARIETFYDTLNKDAPFNDMIERAHTLGSRFAK
jgi:NAD(P)H dehydrogenase (quinone)